MTRDWWQNQSFRAVVISIGSFAIGILFLIILFSFYSVQLPDIEKIFKAVHLPAVVLIIFSSFFHIWITAFKWRFVTQKVTRRPQTETHFFLYSTLIGVLSQVIPLQFCVLIVRTLAIRFHENISLKKGTASVLYDQGFDVIIPLFVVGPALFYVLGVVGDGAFFGWVFLLNLVFIGLILLTGGKVIHSLLRLLVAMPYVGRKIKENIQDQQIIEKGNILAPGTIIVIFVLSLLRYGNLLFRFYLISLAIHIEISVFQVAAAMPAIYLSAILPFTPAGLGIAEWGWVGILTFMGIGQDVATSYALFARILVVLSVVLVFAMVYPVFLILRIYHGRTRLGPG